jgi:DNA gyrase subunit B
MEPWYVYGSTGPRGLHHLVYEVVDNSVDEAWMVLPIIEVTIIRQFCDLIDNGLGYSW